jgi:LTXXQ motif family protein
MELFRVQKACEGCLYSSHHQQELQASLTIVLPLERFGTHLCQFDHFLQANHLNRTPGSVAGGCGSPDAIDRSINEIDQLVQPTSAQRDALGDVRRSFEEAARDLEAHCPTTAPATALNRLDTIQARLDSTWRATLAIQVALANFEAQLDDAQKLRFDTLDFASQ